MLKITITTDVENKEFQDSKVEIESNNSSFEEYITGIIAIMNKIMANNPEISSDALLMLIRQYYKDIKKD